MTTGRINQIAVRFHFQPKPRRQEETHLHQPLLLPFRRREQQNNSSVIGGNGTAAKNCTPTRLSQSLFATCVLFARAGYSRPSRHLTQGQNTWPTNTLGPHYRFQAWPACWKEPSQPGRHSGVIPQREESSLLSRQS